jgi:predicted MFS family arabinose efflux permease
MHAGWRSVWQVMGWIIAAGLAPLAFLIVRRTPESVGLAVDGDSTFLNRAAPPPASGMSLVEALRTPAFWAFALAAAMFGLVSSGLMLFNEAVLRERGFDAHSVLVVLGVITFAGMLANFAGGYLAQRWPIGRLMGVAMFLLAAALFSLPLARGQAILYLYAFAMGTAAGIVTVVFFVCWAKVFGRRHLGAIQGAAQVLTVLASACGPLLLALSLRWQHSSTPLLFALAPITTLLGIACLITPLPKQATPEEPAGQAVIAI